MPSSSYDYFDPNDLVRLETELPAREANLEHLREMRNISTSFVAASGVICAIAAVFVERFRIGLVIGAAIIAIAGFLWFLIVSVNMQSDVEDLAISKRKIAIAKGGATIPGTRDERSSYFDKLVDLNISNLSAYYGMVKRHADLSFNLSAVVGGVGFALVVFGLVIGFSNTAKNSNQTIMYISTGSGILTEFIGSVCFYLYNRTIRQLKEYHDSLLVVQNVLLSFKIVGDLKDDTAKVKTMDNMIVYLLAKPEKTAPPEQTGDLSERRTKLRQVKAAEKVAGAGKS